MKDFMKLDFFQDSVPDAATLLHFRRILKKNNLGKKIFRKINVIYGRKRKAVARWNSSRCYYN